MTQSASESSTVAIEGPGKGKAFFDRARTVADSGSYDYAISMYIDGLNREPQAIKEHQELYDISFRRKLKGGKAGGGLFGPKPPLKGKTAKEAMLNAEWTLARDPGNIGAMQALLRQAAGADYRDVIRWFAPILLLANKSKPRREIYIELADTYEKIEEFEKASEAIRLAIEMSPNDMDLIAKAKNLAARSVLKEGGYENTKQDFQDSIKDREGTKELLEAENLEKSLEHRIKTLEKAQVDYDANPKDHQLINKVYLALDAMDDEEHENHAIEILMKAFVETKTYRYKVAVGNIRIKQFKRNLRMLREAVKAEPNDKSLIESYRAVERDMLAFELAEFHERAENFPTDMGVLFEYGKRLYLSKRYDDAIQAFQVAQGNPRHRPTALHLLGRSFMHQNLKHEALETLQKAITEYEAAETGDQTSKEFHYWLARAYEETNRDEDAARIYSKITQWDIGFLDARKRLEALRKKRGE